MAQTQARGNAVQMKVLIKCVGGAKLERTSKSVENGTKKPRCRWASLLKARGGQDAACL